MYELIRGQGGFQFGAVMITGEGSMALSVRDRRQDRKMERL